MALDRIPAEDHLDHLLAFARLPPEIAPYEAVARARGLRVVEGDVAPEYRLIGTHGFGLMLVDRHLARLHCVGLFDPEDPSDEPDASLGVAVATTFDELAQVFMRLRSTLVAQLGPPSKEGTWRARCLADEEDRDFRFASWRFDESILVLLLDNQGDAHIGEWAALDFRIAARSAEDGLPASVRDVFGWPIAY